MLRSLQRIIPESIIRKELEGTRPVIVIELEDDSKLERKFDIYYEQAEGIYHRCVVVVNRNILIITAMRTYKKLQKLITGDEDETNKI